MYSKRKQPIHPQKNHSMVWWLEQTNRLKKNHSVVLWLE
jgi:hypothetical protein